MYIHFISPSNEYVMMNWSDILQMHEYVQSVSLCLSLSQVQLHRISIVVLLSKIFICINHASLIVHLSYMDSQLYGISYWNTLRTLRWSCSLILVVILSSSVIETAWYPFLLNSRARRYTNHIKFWLVNMKLSKRGLWDGIIATMKLNGLTNTSMTSPILSRLFNGSNKFKRKDIII